MGLLSKAKPKRPAGFFFGFFFPIFRLPKKKPRLEWSDADFSFQRRIRDSR